MTNGSGKLSLENRFLKSAVETVGLIDQTNLIINWLQDQNNKVNVSIEKTQFKNLKKWTYSNLVNRIEHQTGKFFSIEGIRVKTNWGRVNQWEQPIINQPEIGILGIITKEFHGIMHFLMQAKIEPGNVNFVQLSPTLQATKSNFTQMHKGKIPLYLEYFQKAKSDQILLDQLQSEQGARFLKKRNRNIIVNVSEEIEVYDNFIWLTLGQIKELMKYNNLVNMDTRTVISGMPFGSYNYENQIYPLLFGKALTERGEAFLKSAILNSRSINSIEDIITFLTQQKSDYELEVERVSLKDLKDWEFTDYQIHHKDSKYFKVIAVDIEIGNREVNRWSQPMIEPAQEGLCAFVCKEINGILHFAVQAKLECGNFDIIEFAPTVQCLTGNYRQTKEGALPFLEYVINAPSCKIYYDTLQSEEGGRFFREQNRNMIIMAGEEIPIELPERYIWMTLNQLYTFLKFNNYLNIQARSLIAAISFI